MQRPTGIAISSTPQERARGLDHIEDLASPGVFTFDLSRGEAVWILAADEVASRDAPERPPSLSADEESSTPPDAGARRSCSVAALIEASARRSGLPRASRARQDRSSPAIPGSPTGAATPSSRCAGLLPRDRSTRRGARRSSSRWAATVSEGMLPNRFPDRGDTPEYNSVDASLWFVDRRARLLRNGAGRGCPVDAPSSRRWQQASQRDPRRLRRRDALSASAVTATACCAAGEPGRAADVDGRQGRRLAS